MARVGLVPCLRREGGGKVWDVATLVPGDRALHALAAALIPLLEPEMTETDRLREVGKLGKSFAEGEVALRDVVTRALKKQPGTDRLLLLADQWEELYTLCLDEPIRIPVYRCAYATVPPYVCVGASPHQIRANRR